MDKRKKRIWLWVLGWIFIFPVPVTIIIARSYLQKRIKILLISLLWTVIVLLSCFSTGSQIKKAPSTSNYNSLDTETPQSSNEVSFGPALSEETHLQEESVITPDIEESINADNPVDTCLETHFIDVGQGDSTLIVCDGEAMLIDAGDNSKGTTVQLYLKKHNIDELKYVIGTHPDSDHIGGLDVIIYKYPCDTIIMPNVSSDTETYRDVIDTIDYKDYKITYPTVGDEYQLGNAYFVILGPSKRYESNNDNSIVIKLIHGDNSFIFCGDAETEAEADCLNSECDLTADVLKIGHHGSRTSTSLDFLKAVNPQYAVISCGKDNAYGHPHEETLEELHNFGCLVYRTDEQGSIIVTSDGKTLSFNCSPSETWKAGDLPNEDNIEEDNNTDSGAEQFAYILNTNTMRFHFPWCDSVTEMKEKNKKGCNELREEIISEGYIPCDRCKP